MLSPVGFRLKQKAISLLNKTFYIKDSELILLPFWFDIRIHSKEIVRVIFRFDVN